MQNEPEEDKARGGESRGPIENGARSRAGSFLSTIFHLPKLGEAYQFRVGRGLGMFIWPSIV